jgi:N-methylhydantoinase A
MTHVGTAALGRPGRAKPGRLSTPKAPVQFEGKKLATKIYSRHELIPGKSYPSPAIITEYSATTVVPPRKRFHLDAVGNLIILL